MFKNSLFDKILILGSSTHCLKSINDCEIYYFKFQAYFLGNQWARFRDRLFKWFSIQSPSRPKLTGVFKTYFVCLRTYSSVCPPDITQNIGVSTKSNFPMLSLFFRREGSCFTTSVALRSSDDFGVPYLTIPSDFLLKR